MTERDLLFLLTALGVILALSWDNRGIPHVWRDDDHQEPSA